MTPPPNLRVLHEVSGLAMRMIRYGLKLTIVHSATGLPRYQLRALYRDITDLPPRGGPLSTSAGRVLRTRPEQAHASLIAALYAHLDAGPGAYRPIDYDLLLDAYDIYLAMVSPHVPLIDANLAWATVRDLRSGQAVLKDCPACAAPYLFMDFSHLAPSCPLCSWYARV